MKTAKQIRLENLQRLVAEYGEGQNSHGGIRKVAELGQTAESHLSELLREATTPTGSVKGIGDLLARKLERGTGKPEGWLDAEHGDDAPQSPQQSPPQTAVSREAIRPETRIVLLFLDLPQNRQADLLHLAERWHIEAHGGRPEREHPEAKVRSLDAERAKGPPPAAHNRRSTDVHIKRRG